ncbi:MAG: hypothetical protein JHC26_06170 [Thermofilum sp.]|uniref:hypothetical protein n=1 Tax=Thermofilum sp. TaxID=1961369 RepID=UPI00258588D1|nr:hypothetical protein [Thermofilum sp.]MCI4408657.1 hypothetical protein [Thermofilum sp.]
MRIRVAGKTVTVKFKKGMRNTGDHWLASKTGRNYRIPVGEVWLNAGLLNDKKRLRLVLAHERYELNLMLRKKLPYPKAHRLATRYEKKLARASRIN